MSATLTWPATALPGEITPMLGREREAGQVRDLLADPAVRLVTITGPGGVGKTRLALHLAQAARDGGRDVAFVPLAAITDPRFVLPTVLRALGDYRDASDGPVDRLVDLLDGRHALLILDNLEQVRDAAIDLATVLARCPGLDMLITSQAPLGITGEHLFPLAPLPLPSAGASRLAEVEASDAVRLFVARARAGNPAFALDERTAVTVADICRKLDGLPLAIELAAARVRLLSPDALLSRLSNRLQVLGGERRDVPDRLRTMRNAVSWTYDLLGPEERRLFRQLSVFVDGATLEAVEAIAQPSDEDAFALLGGLVDHSLAQPLQLPSGEMRYLLLETLRAFGQEQLEATGETDAARLAHASWYVDLAEAAEPHLVGRDQPAWYERLEPEIDNLRVAVTWTLDCGREDLALRLVGSLWRFFSAKGLGREAAGWLRRALDAPGARDEPARVVALIGAGNLFQDHRDFDIARAHYDEARATATATGNRVAESQALIGLGSVAHDVGDYAAALPLHEQALTLARASGERHLVARALGNLGAVSYYLGRLDDAERYWEEARVTLAALGDTITEAVATGNLGALAFERADLAGAERMHRRALHLQRQIRATRDLPYTLLNLGGVATLQGDLAFAHTCVAEAVGLARESGNVAIEGVALNVAAGLALAEGRIPDAASLVLESVRLVASVGYLHAVVEDAELLADACAAHGLPAAAAELLAAAARGRRELGAEATPFKEQENARIGAVARKALDAEALAAAEAAGEAVDLDALPRRIATIAREIVGERHEPVVITAAPVPQPVDHGLTARELEVLRLLTEGRTTDEVADALFISPRTATTHLTHIMAKLGVSTRTAAVALALREGIA